MFLCLSFSAYEFDQMTNELDDHDEFHEANMLLSTTLKQLDDVLSRGLSFQICTVGSWYFWAKLLLPNFTRIWKISNLNCGWFSENVNQKKRKNCWFSSMKGRQIKQNRETADRMPVGIPMLSLPHFRWSIFLLHIRRVSEITFLH